jgi:hypothetical protein
MADKEAKKIKTATLNEIQKFIGMVPALPKDDILKLIEVMEAPVLRPVPQVSPVLLRPEEMVVFTEAAWPHYSIHYQILISLVTVIPGHPALSSLEHIKKLVGQFALPDATERAYLANYVLAIRAGSMGLTADLLRLVMHECAEYRLGVRSPFVVSPALAIAHGIFMNEPDLGLYLEYIVPLFSAPHFVAFQQQIHQIVGFFVTKGPEASIATFRAALLHFPFTPATKTIEFLRLLVTSLQYVPHVAIRDNLKLLAAVLARCTALGQVKVVTAALPLWTHIDLETLLMDNARDFLMIAYPALLQAQRESWNPGITGVIDEVYRQMNRVDSFVFQEFCRQRAVPQDGEWVKNWAGVARAASKMDRDVHLGDKLAEIQKTFTMAAARFRSTAQATNRAIKGGSLPVTSESPLGVRSNFKAVIRRPVL